jgi:hypothetical protein
MVRVVGRSVRQDSGQTPSVVGREKTLEEASDLRDQLPLYKRLVWLYAVLLGAAGAGILWAVAYWPRVGWLQSDGPNFGADFVGLAITLLLIDRLVHWRRDAELFPRRQAALRQLGRAIRDLEIFLVWSYQAASEPGSPKPESVDGLIEAWASAMPKLDLHALRPDGRRTWLSFVAWRLDHVAGLMDRVVVRQEDVIPIPLAAAIEAVLDDVTLLLLRNEAALAQAITVRPSDYLPAIDQLASALQALYREYASFRGREYRLVGWLTVGQSVGERPSEVQNPRSRGST